MSNIWQRICAYLSDTIIPLIDNFNGPEWLMDIINPIKSWISALPGETQLIIAIILVALLLTAMRLLIKWALETTVKLLWKIIKIAICIGVPVVIIYLLIYIFI